MWSVSDHGENRILRRPAPLGMPSDGGVLSLCGWRLWKGVVVVWQEEALLPPEMTILRSDEMRRMGVRKSGKKG
jgi:hypothetical protein